VGGEGELDMLFNLAAYTHGDAVLMIRQTRTVHLKIDQLLLSLGLMTTGQDYVSEPIVKMRNREFAIQRSGGFFTSQPSR
jgi:hypothetical protein